MGGCDEHWTENWREHTGEDPDPPHEIQISLAHIIITFCSKASVYSLCLQFVLSRILTWIYCIKFFFNIFNNIKIMFCISLKYILNKKSFGVVLYQ
jgi:hypothetical protein